MPHPKATLNLLGRYDRPRGGVPRDHHWDDAIGEWRHNVTNTIRAHDARHAANAARSARHRRTTAAGRARHADQQARSYAARVQHSRNRRHMAARCNDTIFKAGFDLSTVRYAAAHVGTLYDASCDLCGARLFKGEVMASSQK